MKHCAAATFELKSWEEKPYDEMEGGGLGLLGRGWLRRFVVTSRVSRRSST